MTLSHRHANRVRFRVLGDLLDAFAREGLPLILLKGAALAHLLYPSPFLRPLSDIDILVAEEDALRAQALLLRLGFWAPPNPLTRELAGHHHLPGALKTIDGQAVVVEVHYDALSRDSPGSLTTRRLTVPLQEFTIDGRHARALGHADMLYHLCRHTAEVTSLMRLIWMADLAGYVTRYLDVIPWEDLRRRSPFVLNALSLVHLVTPLPPAVLARVGPPRLAPLGGVGVNGKPLTEIFRSGRSIRDISADVFNPSDWWLCFYYGVHTRASLVWHRFVRHPLRVAAWLVRRGLSYVWWRMAQ